MTTSATLDFRTRLHGHDAMLDPRTFVDQTAVDLIERRGRRAGEDATRLGLTPLTLDVDGDPVTFLPSDAGLGVQSGPPTGVVVALDTAAFSDLIQDATSTFGLQFTGRGKLTQGSADDFVAWEPVLRYLIDGREVYEPGSIEFFDRSGGPLDLRRSFLVDEDPEEIGHFLCQAGYLHLRGVFTEEEMAAVAAEHDQAMAEASQDDGSSWWARTADEGWYACRILGFNRKSPTLRELLRSRRFRTITSFTADHWAQRDPDTADAAEGLFKKIGVVEGASDVSWHKDCSMGGHSRGCCGLTVGISVTGAGPQNGELGVVAGSHRANISPLGATGLDLPKIPLPTGTGDLTVHCSCTLHMSRPPVSADRRVVYTGFGLAPRDGDQIVELSAEEARRQRASLNDHTRRQQRESPLTPRLSGHDL
jgi:Phytanoyl-CoA dioxygenase (PhyH)